MRNKALVIGGNHQNTLGVIEALGQKGVYSYVIILGRDKASFVLESKFVTKGWICENEEAVITTILNGFPSADMKIVTIACCDDAANILDSHYERLCNLLHIPTVKETGRLFAWTNKERMTETAQSLGITIPASWVVYDNEIPNDVTFPCIIKPITSVNHGKIGFAKCVDKEELQSCLDGKKNSEPIQIQQFIEKDFEFQFIGCSLNAGEEIIIPGRTHI